MVRMAAVVVGSVLTVAGCGPADGTDRSATPEAAVSTTTLVVSESTTSTVAGPGPAPATTAVNLLPDIAMVDVESAAEVNLRSLAGAAPILFWFWAPH
ncbi:MAG: hypothetical protein ACRDWI_19510 [Jiangellaceae bacterium]